MLFFLPALVISQFVDSTTYPFSVFTGIGLESMVNADTVIEAGVTLFAPATTVGFGSGFKFCLDGNCFDSLTVKMTGIARLGTTSPGFSINIASIYPEVAPLSARMVTGVDGKVTKKMFGISPNRKFVVEWDVAIQSISTTSSATDKFQLWLHENGRIDYVYGNTPASWNGTSNQEYQIGFSYGNITNGAFGNVKVLPNVVPINSIASYATVLGSQTTVLGDSIKFSFIPDSVNVSPPPVQLSSTSAKCIEFLISDTTQNELGIKVFKSSDSVNYTNLYTNIQTNTFSNTDQYIVKDSILNQNQSYHYGVVAYNLGHVPDTIYITASTTLPAMTGTKNIPGDYNSISEAIRDIKCVQLAGPTVLELGPTYNSSLESFPIVLDGLINSDSAKTLTIRPAVNSSNLSINNLKDTAMFLLNGVDYVTFDGRPGGIVENNDLSFSQDSSAQSIFILKNASQHIVIKNNNLLGQGAYDNKPNSLISIENSNCSQNKIVKCHFTPITGQWLEYGIHSVGNNNSPNSNNMVDSCQFSNFGSQGFSTVSTWPDDLSAIYLAEGNSDWTISNSHFFMTDTVKARIPTSVIKIKSPESAGYQIAGNFFGGSAPFCLGSPMAVESTGPSVTTYHFIDIESDSLKMNYLSNNTIKNLHLKRSGSPGGANFRRLHLITVNSGAIDINNNKIGDSSNVNDIIYENLLSSGNIAIIAVNEDFNKCSKVNISNNSIYSFKNLSGNKLKTISVTSYNYSGVPSNIVIDSNSIGTNQQQSLESNSLLIAIDCLFGNDTVMIKNNEIKNILGNGFLYGIYIEDHSSQNISVNDEDSTVFIINNTIEAFKYMPGVSSTGPNYPYHVGPMAGIICETAHKGLSISHNKISDFECIAYPSAKIYGIHTRNQTAPQLFRTNISYNFIHNLWAATSSSVTEVSGILTHENSLIENNMIALGTDRFGTIDSGYYRVRGITIWRSDEDSVIVRHNSIYITSDSVSIYNDYQARVTILAEWNSNPTPKHYNVTNNILASNGFGYSLGLPAYLLETCDYNQYYMGRNNFFNEYGANVTFTFPEWTSSTGFDQNSFIAPHHFLNPEGGTDSCDLHLEFANFAESSGIANDLYDDIDLDNRALNSPTDIGADAGNFHQIPNFNFESDSIFVCNNDSLKLPYSEHLEYLWNTGDTTSSIAIPVEGLYSFQMTDSLGNSSSDSIFVLLDSISPIVLHYLSSSICIADSLIISLNSGNYTNLWSTGQITDSIIIYNPGYYSAIITNSNGCFSTDSVLVTNDSLYQFEFSDTITLCEQDSVLVTNFPSQFTYTFNTATISDSIYFYPSTVNSFTATSSYGCVTNDTIIVLRDSIYQYEFSDTLVVCLNDSILMANLPVGYDYFWNGTNNTDSIYLFGNTNNTLVSSSQYGCSVLDTILVLTDSLYNYNYSDSISICSNDSSLYIGSPSNFSFLWNNNLTSDSIYLIPNSINSLKVTSDYNCVMDDTITVTSLPSFAFTLTPIEICNKDSVQIFGQYQSVSGTFIDSLISINGCDSIVSQNLLVNNLSQISFYLPDSICQTADSLELIAIPSGGQFIGNSVTGGYFYPNLNAFGSSVIKYSYTDSNNCISEDSTDILVVDCIGLGFLTKISVSPFQIYPNPTYDIINIKFTKLIEEKIQIIVSDQVGRILQKSHYASIDNLNIDLSEFSSGIYNISINLFGASYSHKIIKL